MTVIVRSFAGASSVMRLAAAKSMMPAPQATLLPRNFRTFAPQMAKPTGSEASVHAEKHDKDPSTLQKETANKAQSEHKSSSTAAPNDNPTHSEDFVHADKHEHDPLPDHKKASNKK